MKSTANTHASFSLPDVLLEVIITNRGNSQMKPAISKIMRKPDSACIHVRFKV